MGGVLWLLGHSACGAQILEGAELDFSRYGDTLFEVLFAVRGLLADAAVLLELAGLACGSPGQRVATRVMTARQCE